MWLLMILWKTFRGMWRLVIGLVIGVVLYVVTFTTPGLEWLFNSVHDFSKDVIYWLRGQSWFGEYEKWDNLVKPGDRLPLILYVLVGRFVWLMIEAVFLTFPYWLLFGRSKDGDPSGGSRSMSMEQKSQAVAQGISDKLIRSAAPAGAAVTPASELVAASTPSVAVGLDELEENAEKMEQSIDDALERIKNVGHKT